MFGNDNNNRNIKSPSVFSQAMDFTGTVASSVAFGLGARKSLKLIMNHINSNTAVNTVQSEFAHIVPGLSQVSKNMLQQTGMVDQSLVSRLSNMTTPEGLFNDTGIVSLSPNDIASIWERTAIRSGVPIEIVESLAKTMREASSGQQVMSDMAYTLTNNPSVYMQKASRNFISQVELYNERQKSGKSIFGTNFDISHSEFARRTGYKERYLPLSSLKDIKIQTDLRKIQDMLQAESVSLKVSSRSDRAGASMVAKFHGGVLGSNELSLNIPGSLPENPGIFINGAAQQSKYISGEYGIVSSHGIEERLSHQQWVVRKAQEELIPSLMNERKLTRSLIRQRENQFNLSMLETGMYVPTVQPGVQQSLDELISMRSQSMRLYEASPSKPAWNPHTGTFSFEKISSEKYQKLIEQGTISTPTGDIDIFPGYSPSMDVHRSVALTDPRKRHFAWQVWQEERPSAQFIRPEFSPTKSAMKLIQNDTTTQKYRWAAVQTDIASPMVRTAFLSERHAEKLAMSGIGTQGMGFIDRDLSSMLEIQKLTPFQMSTKNVMDLAPYINKESGTWNVNETLAKGSVLGEDLQGKPIKLKSNTTIQSISLMEDKSKGQYYQITATQDINAKRFKSFLNKLQMEKKSGSALQKLTNEIAGTSIGRGAIEAIIPGGELAKNRSMYYQQLFTSLNDFIRLNMNRNRNVSDLAKTFATNPRDIFENILNSSINSQGIHSQEQVVWEAIKRARAGGLTPGQMGGVFGITPDVLKMRTSITGLQEDWAKIFGPMAQTDEERVWATLTRKEAKQIRSGYAVGYTQFFTGDIAAQGAGKRATVEPRLFEMLESPTWGEYGPEVRQDLLYRMSTAYPEKWMQQEMLGKSAASLIKPTTLSDAYLPSQLTDKIRENEFRLRIPDVGDVIVPSSQEIKQLAFYKNARGTMLSSQLNSGYSHMIEMAKMREQGSISKEAMQDTLNNLATQVGQARNMTIGGKGGILRDRVPGSQFLTLRTATSKTEQDILKYGEIGITKPTAEKLFSEAETIFGQGSFQSMKEKLFAGEAITGLSWRHPAIGPYSMSTSPIRLIPGKGNKHAVIREYERNVLLANREVFESERQEMEILRREAERNNEVAIQTIKEKGYTMKTQRFSSAVGQAGDYDVENIGLSFMNPDLSSRITTQTTSDEYTHYIMRQQLMKGKARKGAELSLNQMLADAAIKRSIPKEYLGSLSNEIASSRAAVLLHSKSLGKVATTNALGVLDLMEQTPISGKHLAPGEARKTVDTVQSLTSGLQGKGSLSTAIEDLFAHEPETSPSRQILRKDITAVAGDNLTMKLSSYNLEEAARNIVESRQKTSQTLGGITFDRMRRLVTGQAKPTIEEIPTLLSSAELPGMGGLLRPVVSQEAMNAGKGTFARLSEKVMGFQNKLAASGKGILPLLKPLGLGFGASLLIGSFFSEPKLSISPSSMVPPRPNTHTGSGGQDMTPEQIMPPSIDGSPTTGPSIPPQSARITSTNNKVVIRGRTNSRHIHPQSMYQEMQRSGYNQGSVNIRDNRQSLTPQKISDIIKNNR